MSFENPPQEPLLPSSFPQEHESSAENMRITPEELKRLRREQGDIALWGTGEQRPTDEPVPSEDASPYDKLFDPDDDGSESTVEDAAVRPVSPQFKQYNVNGDTYKEKL